jgi:hypothetical protein
VNSAFGSRLSEPAREAVLLRFTNQLRGLPPFSIDTAVLDFLLNYQNQTLVAHEESIGMAVPLFPIRAAAHGLVFQWTRQQAALDAATLMTGQPKQIVDVYAANTDRNIRSGIEAAIGQADPETLQSMLDYGMPLLSVNSGLTALLGKSAMELGDVQAVSEVFIQGGGHELVEISRLAGQRFSNPDLGNILLMTIDAAPASTAALLIAEMAPYSIVQQEVSEALLQKLGDAELGSAAALALGRWGSAQQREALAATVAKDPSSLAAKRAQRALYRYRAEACGDETHQWITFRCFGPVPVHGNPGPGCGRGMDGGRRCAGPRLPGAHSGRQPTAFRWFSQLQRLACASPGPDGFHGHRPLRGGGPDPQQP